MHIALLTDGLHPYKIGGMQKHSRYLAQSLARAGVTVDLYFSTREEPEKLTPPIHQLSATPGLNVHPVALPRLPYFPGHYLRQSWLLSRKFYEALHSRPPVDFIYAQGLTGWYFFGRTEAPVGVHPHGLEMFQPANSLKDRLEKALLRRAMGAGLRRADAVFLLGEHMRNVLPAEVRQHRPLLLSPNGIAPHWIRPVDVPRHDPVRFLFVGRYEYRKGVAELNTVLQKLHRQDIPFDMQFVGPIPETQQLKHPHISYLGPVRDEAKLQGIFAGCDVLLCPSHSEGMPTVILEAMASGLAVVATEVGAVPSMVSAENGWLIPPKSAERLEGAIRAAVACPPETLLAKKQHSQQKVKANFLWEAVAATTIREIKKALAA